MTWWRPGAATGVGSYPGVDPRESARIVAGELPDLLHVVELPGRGPGADMIGRTGALLCAVEPGFGLETTPEGWRISGSRGRAMRLGQSWIDQDLDCLEEVASAYRGPVKVQLVGPWTMAASVELRGGERMLRDHGAVDDCAAALAEVTVRHVHEVRRRFAHASSILVQVDEPALPGVLAGAIGTASGLSRYPAEDPQRVGRLLGSVLNAAAEVTAVPGVHCCGSAPPVALLSMAGAMFVSVDVTLLGSDGEEGIGAMIEGGRGVIAGVVTTTPSPSRSDAVASAPLRALLHRLGLEDDAHLRSVAISPTCGLAGVSPAAARQALAACNAVGRLMRQDESGGEVDVR